MNMDYGDRCPETIDKSRIMLTDHLTLGIYSHKQNVQLVMLGA